MQTYIVYGTGSSDEMVSGRTYKADSPEDAARMHMAFLGFKESPNTKWATKRYSVAEFNPVAHYRWTPTYRMEDETEEDAE